MTIAAAILRDHAGAIDACGDTILMTRARRPAGVNSAGAVRMAGDVPLRLESFSRHCCVRLRRARDGDGDLVAGDLPLDAQTTVDPPERRMPSRDDADDDLQDVDEIVTPLHVRPLVDQHAIQFVGIERPHERRRDGDHRRSPPEHRSGRHRIGQDERGTPARHGERDASRAGPILHGMGTHGCGHVRDGCATIAETNLTIWMPAQSVHAARTTSVDVHQASGSETIASLPVARNALGQRRVVLSEGVMAVRARRSRTARRPSTPRIARWPMRVPARTASDRAPPRQRLLATASSAQRPSSRSSGTLDQFPEALAFRRVDLLVLEHVQHEQAWRSLEQAPDEMPQRAAPRLTLVDDRLDRRTRGRPCRASRTLSSRGFGASSGRCCR